ncbi:MAG: ABC transporter ATP-binding protein [Thermodesulfobacteriota bacterium]
MKNLKVYYRTTKGIVQAVDDVSFSVEEGESLGLVGESGCGKTTAVKAILRLFPTNIAHVSGTIEYKGQNILQMTFDELSRMRWKEISMIPQSAMNALDPVYTIEDQIREAIQAHDEISYPEALQKIYSLFDLVGVERSRLKDYPHQLSGGMLQRACIAMALVCGPKIILADEPTTALDVVVQDNILQRINELHKKIKASMILSSHDISVIAETCDKVAVMYAGQFMEYASSQKIFGYPFHPYTLGLRQAFPSIKGTKKKLIAIKGYPPNLINPPRGCRFASRCPFMKEACVAEDPPLIEVEPLHFSRCIRADAIDEIRGRVLIEETWEKTSPLPNRWVRRKTESGTMDVKQDEMIEVRDLRKYFPLEKGFLSSLFSREETKFLKAVDGISFDIHPGEILGLAGESGCGKTTTAKTLVGLYTPTTGKILFGGQEITELMVQDKKRWARTAQYIFQNPYESLNPRQTVLDAVIEGLKIHRIGTKEERVEMAAQALSRVKIMPPSDFFDRFPHQLSGGQRQRISIARALVLNPKLVIADEPVSMLDVSIRAEVINLLKELTEQMHLASLFISHDISLIRYICDRTAIMYLGKIVEIGPTDEIIDHPFHPYTQLLLSAVPVPDPEAGRIRIKLHGDVPNPINLPPGCRFGPRCERATDACRHDEPEQIQVGKDHFVLCHEIL